MPRVSTVLGAHTYYSTHHVVPHCTSLSRLCLPWRARPQSYLAWLTQNWQIAVNKYLLNDEKINSPLPHLLVWFLHVSGQPRSFSLTLREFQNSLTANVHLRLRAMTVHSKIHHCAHCEEGLIYSNLCGFLLKS